jgi:hypothetical protein
MRVAGLEGAAFRPRIHCSTLARDFPEKASLHAFTAFMSTRTSPCKHAELGWPARHIGRMGAGHQRFVGMQPVFTHVPPNA